MGAVLALVPLWLGDPACSWVWPSSGWLCLLHHWLQPDLRQHRTALPLCRRPGRYRWLRCSHPRRQLGLPIVVSILVATLAATLIGGLLSWIAVRRSLGVIFTGIITLIFSLAFDDPAARAQPPDRWGYGLFHLVGSRRLPATPDSALLPDAGSRARLPAGPRSAEAVPRRLGISRPARR